MKVYVCYGSWKPAPRPGGHPRGVAYHARWARRPRRRRADVARVATISELEDWERNGAVWRPAEVYSQRAVVDLCSCTGELMERVESDDPEFVEFVRERRDE